MKFFQSIVIVALIASAICVEVSQEVDSTKEYLPPVGGEVGSGDESHSELGDYLNEVPVGENDHPTENESKNPEITTIPAELANEGEDSTSPTSKIEAAPAYSLETDGYHYRAPEQRRFRF